jgi:hypothetical protein
LDSENDEHEIVFVDGVAIAVICPRLGECRITETE